MNEDSVQNTEPKTTHRRYHVATVVVFVLAILIGIALMYAPNWFAHEVFAPEKSESITEVKGEVMNESQPTRLIIPSINVDTSFETPLGLKENREIEVPESYIDVAYYKNGPTPGELGPSVILGHVDSVDGPAVFFSLGQLKEGDEIKVEREDGTTAVFGVTSLERHSQSDFPTREVYSDIDHAGLRLITCTGLYEKDVLRYTHNLIVFAKLVRVE
jgi:LPXTG-site transpeptidase (sortase) family protein